MYIFNLILFLFFIVIFYLYIHLYIYNKTKKIKIKICINLKYLLCEARGELTLESDIEGSGVAIGRQVHFTLRQKR